MRRARCEGQDDLSALRSGATHCCYLAPQQQRERFVDDAAQIGAADGEVFAVS